MVHYQQHIQNFGAPNSLCLSIIKSKHITTVKQPWHQSNHYNPIGQIMLTNQQMEKLTIACICFTLQGMLNFPTWQLLLPYSVPSDDNNNQMGLQTRIPFTTRFSLHKLMVCLELYSPQLTDIRLGVCWGLLKLRLESGLGWVEVGWGVGWG